MAKLILPRSFVFDPIPRTNDEEICLALLGVEGVKEMGDFKGDDEVVFSIIRNPFELVKIWFDLNPFWTDFGKFIKEYNHSHFVRNGKLFWSDATHLIKWEDCPTELEAYLRDEYGIQFKCPLINFTPDYRDAYSPEAIELVNERFGSEIEAHGYEF